MARKTTDPKITTLVRDRFVRANAEAHRRRATLIDPPLASFYAAIARPDTEAPYEPFLRSLLDAINQHPEPSDERKDATGLTDVLIAGATQHFDINDDEQTGTTTGVHLTISIKDARWQRGRWRIEAHRDFVAVTLFAGLDIVTDDRLTIDLLPRTSKDSPDLSQRRTSATSGTNVPANSPHHIFEAEVETTGNVKVARGLSAFLFHDLPRLLAQRMDPLVEALETWAETTTPTKEVEATALIYGVTAPWTLIKLIPVNTNRRSFDEDLLTDRIGARPVFPEIDSAGFASAEELHLARTKTNRFLTQHWSAFDDTKDGLVSKKASDSVACYVMNGHGVYISSLGSKRPDESPEKSPLKYLLLYEDPGLNGSAESDLIVPSNFRGASKGYNFSWRLGRFIGRLHELGSTRLAALSEYQIVSPFLEKLRRLEAKFYRLHDHTPESIDAIERQLIGHAFDQTKSIPKRASLARYYRAGIERLLGDLGVISLPTFQPYDQFLRRRVYGAIDRMASATERYEGFLRRLNSAKQTIQTKHILEIQKTADVIGLLVFTYYGMRLGHTIVEYGHNMGFHLVPSLPAGLVGLACGALLGMLMWRHAGRNFLAFIKKALERGPKEDATP